MPSRQRPGELCSLPAGPPVGPLEGPEAQEGSATSRTRVTDSSHPGDRSLRPAPGYAVAHGPLCSRCLSPVP